jgi:hypothetical protein
MRGTTPVHALHARLVAAFERAKTVPSDDLELKSDLSKYLCVLVSGFLETAVSTCAIEYCRKRSIPQVAKYATQQLSQIQNLKTEKLLQVVGSFDADWRARLEPFIKDGRKDAVDSVVDLRNKIAHGENVTVTFSRVNDYFVLVAEVVFEIEQIFDT